MVKGTGRVVVEVAPVRHRPLVSASPWRLRGPRAARREVATDLINLVRPVGFRLRAARRLLVPHVNAGACSTVEHSTPSVNIL